MPHKRQKRSVRLDLQKAIGYNNPPTAADSLLPIQSTSKDGSEAVTEVAAAPKNNKRRKRAASTGGNGLAGQQDYAGVSKSAFRVLNAVKLREEYHAQKKRRAEEEAQAGKAGNKSAQPALTPLPHESLSSFNRRVEQAMRGSVRAAIKESSLTGQKKKERKGKAKKAEEGGEGEGGDGDEIAEEDARPVKRGRDGKALLKKGTAATPEESVDPFAKRKKKTSAANASDDDDQDAPRNRSGKTEFAAVSQRRRVDDVVQAPPTLADPARKGLMAKVLGPGGAAACGVPSAAAGTGGSGTFRLAGAETPVGSSRLPINPAMKAMMDAERERAIKMYRELKEKREQERAPRK